MISVEKFQEINLHKLLKLNVLKPQPLTILQNMKMKRKMITEILELVESIIVLLVVELFLHVIQVQVQEMLGQYQSMLLRRNMVQVVLVLV